MSQPRHGIAKNSTTKSMGVVGGSGKHSTVHGKGSGFPDKHVKNVTASAKIPGTVKPTLSRGYTLYKKFDY
jgi:hypothetical protein